MLKDRGVSPESLPIAEDVKKVQRRLESEGKKVLNDIRKIQNKKS